MKFVNLYTQRAISDPTDKFLAIADINKESQTALGDKCYSGSWSKDILFGFFFGTGSFY